MPFSEICIYQVKPQKVEEFEALMLEAKNMIQRKTTGWRKRNFMAAIGSEWKRA